MEGRVDVTDPWIELARRAVPPVGRYSQARSVRMPGGALVFLAGQVALDADGNLVGAADPLAQARQVYTNIASILRQGGGSLGDVVRLVTFATAAVPIADAVAVRENFPGGTTPATTFTYVHALADPRFLLEVEATAFVRDGVA
jgi:enamine deaminase RidA (YjgF/YER057c/UK114 family)